MIEVNKGNVRVKGDINIVESEVSVLLMCIYDENPESIKLILECLKDYMDGKFKPQHWEVHNDSF